jgi:plastocyanin
MRCRTAGLALCASLWACVDLGALPDPDASTTGDASSRDASADGDAGASDGSENRDAGEGDAGAPCVEGSVDPLIAENIVNLVRFTVDPLEIRIAPGSILGFSNSDTRNHRMLAGTPESPIDPAAGGFNTGLLAPGAAYAHRFCDPRTLLYYCSTHPGVMNGYRIVIE